jgi:hypothetical protein
MHAFSNSFHGTSCKKKMPMNVRVWNYTSWLCKKKVVKSIGVHYQPFVYKKMPRKV